MTTPGEKRQRFEERYQSGEIPWDTGITPPEIEAIVAELPPGRAIDAGCGTGTNVRYLLEHGWQADGVDFIQAAIDTARTKLADFPAGMWGVFCHDVTDLMTCEGLRPPYDLAVDIGCGHNIVPAQCDDYVRGMATLLHPGAIMMLYAHYPSETRTGWTPDDVKRLFEPYFDIVDQVLSEDTTNSRPSGWYRLVKR